MLFQKPQKYFLILAIILIVILSFLSSYFIKINFLYAYLVSINLVTLLFYGYDKYQAGNNGFRIPEIVLHLLALIGGSPGALLGQILFRHKTRKLKFLLVFIMIVIIQVVVIAVWVSRK
ncbi:MAG: DUF1294 domain-containing protein [Planctomycetota bacterium]